ncbi:DUF885 domain-containing protein [Sphingomonas baiyangensis]|uniref:DUF885 family protein n=1 Tax=Sphingomonas baiyangensis TaxID=2572576 RepID=A0A4U1L4F6_9SPHN|nr:DUF885 family protein [Sphingomonas baiyangensis]TKD51130.1 DUF885 family protein [Sphingomonas baiyangensis]
MSRRSNLLLALGCAIAFPLPPAVAQTAPAAAQSPEARLRALYDADWQWRLAQTGQRDSDEPGESAGDRLPRVSPAAQAERVAHWRAMLAQLDAVPMASLPREERINAAVFRTTLEADLAGSAFRPWEMPFNADSNFWSYLAGRSGYRTADQYRRYIARMRDVPRYFDEHIANMQAGLARGFSVPRVTLEGRDASITAFAEPDVTKNPFWAPIAAMPASIPAAERAAIEADARAAISQAVVPAYGKLLGFFRETYLPKARTSLAADALPQGKAFYAQQIREYTTLDLTPEAIHAIGLKEVARIEAEMAGVMKAAKFDGDLKAFTTFLRTDPQFVARTPDELMGVSSYVAKRVDGRLKDFFGLLPRYRFAIREVDPAIAPFYTAGRGGLDACQMNTYDLPSRPLYNIPALTLHECAPGHSFQAALALEGPDRPKFRGRTYFSGYGEGWGLYTEWLGTLMGVYRTPYEDFGRLSYEMWRAARLVIDTGIHRYGWSRDKAIAYLADHTALSRREVETEVDRYISWPGQALAYKLGEMSIRRKRAEAEAKLGERFDQRWFHDMILDLGSVPLPVLEDEIDRWIAAGGPDTLKERRG